MTRHYSRTITPTCLLVDEQVRLLAHKDEQIEDPNASLTGGMRRRAGDYDALSKPRGREPPSRPGTDLCANRGRPPAVG